MIEKLPEFPHTPMFNQMIMNKINEIIDKVNGNIDATPSNEEECYDMHKLVAEILKESE